MQINVRQGFCENQRQYEDASKCNVLKHPKNFEMNLRYLFIEPLLNYNLSESDSRKQGDIKKNTPEREM